MATTARIEFEFNNQRFTDAAKGLEAFAKRFDGSLLVANTALRKELQKYLGQVKGALKARHSQKWRPGGSPPDKLYQRTGAGIKGIRFTTRMTSPGDLNTLLGKIIVPFPLNVHERGATIRPTRARFLTVPLPAALDNQGVPIRPRARDWPNTFVKETRKGNLLIFQKRGAQLIPLYVLKRQVRLPPRLGVIQTLNAGSDFFLDSAIEAMFKAISRQL